MKLSATFIRLLNSLFLQDFLPEDKTSVSSSKLRSCSSHVCEVTDGSLHVLFVGMFGYLSWVTERGAVWAESRLQKACRCCYIRECREAMGHRVQSVPLSLSFSLSGCTCFVNRLVPFTRVTLSWSEACCPGVRQSHLHSEESFETEPAGLQGSQEVGLCWRHQEVPN